MKRFVKAMSVVTLLALLVSSVLAGCGSEKAVEQAATQAATQEAVEATKSEATAVESDSIDISKKVVIKGYLLPDQPQGAPAVYEELNKKLEKDLNCTMDLKFTGWTDWQNKYAMVLASGEPLDFIYTSSWSDYAQNAAKSAFSEIDMSLMGKYMPKSYAAISPEAWKDCQVNGKIYMIPASNKEILAWGYLYREDLRKKYGAPEIKKMSDVTTFLEAVKANDPSMIPYNMSKYDIMNSFLMQLQDLSGYGQNAIKSGDMYVFEYDIDDPNGTLKGIFDEDYVASYKKAAEITKSLYDKGLVPKNPYSNQTRSMDVITENKTAIAYANTEEAVDLYAKAKAKGMELKHVMVTSLKGKIASKPASTNGIGIPNNAQNVERMMMAMDLIMQEESYNYLMSFGIEGKNYVITDDGRIGMPEGMTPDQNIYPLHGEGWWFCNRDIWKPFATWEPFFIEQKQQIASVAISYPLESFNPLYDSVKTELANSQNVQAKYENTILIGAVKDIDAAVAELQEQYKVAGFDKVQAEVKKQVEAFLAARK